MTQLLSNRITALITAFLLLCGAYVPAKTQLQVCIGEQGHFAIDVVSHLLCVTDCEDKHPQTTHQEDDACHHDHEHDHPAPASTDHPPCVDLTLSSPEAQLIPPTAAPLMAVQAILLPQIAWHMPMHVRIEQAGPMIQAIPPPDSVQLSTIILLV